MKRSILIVVTLVMLVALVVGASSVMAAKPQKAIEMSNGMPSGEHETLIIHGKKADYNCTICVPSPEQQCNVINIPEYGQATIRYVSGKKVKIDELTVFDSCAGWDGDDPVVDDPAEVWLPHENDGYWVFARALGKPGKDEVVRRIIFENDSLEAYPLYEDVSDPSQVPVILPLGMITKDGTFKMDASGWLHRFDGDSDKGKGKSQGRNITDMFMWYGWVFHPDLDLNGDGVVDTKDVVYLCGYDFNIDGTIDNDEFNQWISDTSGGYDANGDTLINWMDVVYLCGYDTRDIDGVIYWDEDYNESTFPDCEFEDWLYDNQGDPDNPLWAYYDEEDPIWVFTIADLVYLNQVVTNEGIKNVQIRFYPKDTTEFTPFEQ